VQSANGLAAARPTIIEQQRTTIEDATRSLELAVDKIAKQALDIQQLKQYDDGAAILNTENFIRILVEEVEDLKLGDNAEIFKLMATYEQSTFLQ
jgi:hypothetical protein